MRFTHELLIEAPVDRVWSLTEDVEGWPSLTPTMTSVERLDAGPLRSGSTARVDQPRLRPATWTVTEVDPPRRFGWETTLRGLRIVAHHDLEPAGDGTRNRLTLDLSGTGAQVLSRVAGPALRTALATENDGFRRAAEGLMRPPYVDEHRTILDVPSAQAWEAVRRYAAGLSGHERPLLSPLLGLRPASGFEVAEEVPERLLGLAGRHRFSRYALDFRLAPVGDRTQAAAVTYADFSGLRGRAYRIAVVGSRGHVLAVRRMLRAIRAGV